MLRPETPENPICTDVSSPKSGSDKHQPSTAVVIVLALLIDLFFTRSTIAAGQDSEESQPAVRRTADSLASHAIFQDECLQDNTLFIHQAASSKPLSERFEFLADWVLPSHDHPTFRVTGEFGPTNPPPFAEQPAGDAAQQSPGVVVMSPAVDLVETARQLDRLKELRRQIISTSVSSDVPQQVYAKTTLLFLIDVALNDFDSATIDFDNVMAVAETLDQKTVEARWPALLMLRAAFASSDENIRRHVTEYFFSVYQDLREYSPIFARDVLNDHLRTLFAFNVFADEKELLGERPVGLSQQWLPFVYSDSETRGHGRPPARWFSESGYVRKFAGHEMDYLSFKSPLRGNYEVECNFSTEHGKQCSFLVGGSRVQAAADRASVTVGNFRKHATELKLERPLTKFEWAARFRATVRDGVLTHFLNGEPVFKRELPDEYNPWVAIRTWRRSLGSVRDFRITGSPTIPDEINLTGDAELSGWAPYFEEGFGPVNGNWQTIDDGQGGTAIFGRRRPEFAGSAVQKLLRYCRPVAEDGTIEYDFFYRQGEACVHPALDRLAFLLDHSGVKIHWITDRRYERFAIDPANVSEDPSNRRGPSPLPLQNDAWNRLKIDVKGNVVQLALNGEPIYERVLEDSNQRTFGLFHYADRTEARVRNVVWRGDWPKQLPPIHQQELADRELDFLDDRLPQLKDTYHHDFRIEPFQKTFSLNGDETSIEQNGYGIQAKLVSGTGFKELRSRLQVEGDFDLIVAFQDLEILMPEPRWSAGIGVRVVLDSATGNTLGMYRTLARNANNRRTSFYHSFRDPDGKLQFPGDYSVEESRAGRFRLARRGATFYALYAADDSPNFRLIGKHEATVDPVAVRGLRLIAKAADSVSVTATWKDILIRAEKISGLPLSRQEEMELVTKLNARRDSLRARRIEFADSDSLEASVRTVASGSTVLTPEDDGLRVTTVSTGRQEQYVIANRIPFNRAVDVEFAMDIHKFGLDDKTESPCEIAMKVFYGTSIRDSRNPGEATFILRKKSNGVRDLVTRIVHRNSANGLEYLELLSTPVDSPDAFRVAVHEGTMYFLYSESDSENYHIAAMSPVGNELPAVGFNLKFVTNGEQHSTDLTMKHLTAHEPAEADTESIIRTP